MKRRLKRLLKRILAPFRKRQAPARRKRIFVLLDYENIRPDPESVDRLRGADIRIFVFAGARDRASFELVAVLQPLGVKVEYVRIDQTGKNALDFHIACALGLLANTAPPHSHVFVVSADRGYDSMIAWVGRITRLRVGRVAGFSALAERVAKLNPLAARTHEDAPRPADDFFHLVLPNARRRDDAVAALPEPREPPRKRGREHLPDQLQDQPQRRMGAGGQAAAEKLERLLLECATRPRTMKTLRGYVAGHFPRANAAEMIDILLERGSIVRGTAGRVIYFPAPAHEAEAEAPAPPPEA